MHNLATFWSSNMCVNCAQTRDDHAPNGKCLFESTSFKAYVPPKLIFNARDPHELAELQRLSVQVEQPSWRARVKAFFR